MSRRPWTDRLQDILEAVAEIQAFVEGMDFKAFRSDAKTIKAVELDLILIGEAAGQVPQSVQDGQPAVPWHLMKAMRNRLVHVYFSVDPQIVWDTIHNDLPPLVEALQGTLRDAIE